MSISAETIQAQIPYYLTQEQKDGLVKALAEFPNPIQYYISRYPNELLQGDGWEKLEIVRFENGARDKIKGILLSNSCDISADNKREIPPKITFAPIIKLSNYSELLLKSGLTQQQINDRFQKIREQRITTMFYLPKSGSLEEEHVALLDDLHTVPAQAFEKVTERKKLFTLSLVGFYLFLLKLSVHFCRFHEEVAR
jgi:ATP-dependent helicase YprA (DUF1998 family)